MGNPETNANAGLSRLQRRGDAPGPGELPVADAGSRAAIASDNDLDLLERKVLGAVRGAVTGVIASRNGEPEALDLDLDFAKPQADTPPPVPAAKVTTQPPQARVISEAISEIVEEPDAGGATVWHQFGLIVAGSLAGVAAVAMVIWLVQMA